MGTFKQVAGFILMATVIFLLHSFGQDPRNVYLVAMLSLLLSIAIGCWWIGRTSLAAELPEKFKAWGLGLGIIVAGAVLSFTFLGPPRYELNWQEFSKARLGELRAASRIVFIDFTGPN
jgi:thiol:disulfide interchange protein DsbD